MEQIFLFFRQGIKNLYQRVLPMPISVESYWFKKQINSFKRKFSVEKVSLDSPVRLKQSLSTKLQCFTRTFHTKNYFIIFSNIFLCPLIGPIVEDQQDIQARGFKTGLFQYPPLNETKIKLENLQLEEKHYAQNR